MDVNPDLGILAVIFLFVAFLVVANLVSKHFAQRHERAVKLGEPQSEPFGGWMFLGAVAVLVVLLGGLYAGGMPYLGALGALEIIFVFVAFVVIANLVSKHFTIKHQQALEHRRVPDVPVVQKDKPKKRQMSYLMKVGILSALSSIIPLVVLSFFGGVSVDHVAVRDVSQQTIDSSSIPRGSSRNLPKGSLTPLPPPVPLPLPEPINRWTNDLPFDALHYPSIEASAAPFARQIVEAIRVRGENSTVAETSDEEKPPKDSPIYLSKESFGEEEFLVFKAALKNKIMAEMPTVEFVSDNSKDAHKFRFHWKYHDYDEYLVKSSKDTFMGKMMRYRRGIVACKGSVIQEDGEREDCRIESVKFFEKPWLNDLEYFASQYPQSHLYVGVSAKFELSKGMAQKSAIADVAKQLSLTTEAIESDIVDEFIQTIERPAGVVYRAAVLVRDPPKRFQLAQQAPAEYRRANGRRVNETTPIAAVQPKSLPSIERAGINNWADNLPFDADQYPSIEACALPLARHIAKEIKAEQSADVDAETTDSGAEKRPEAAPSIFIVNKMYSLDFVGFKNALQEALKVEIPSVSFHSRTGAKKYVLAFSFDELQQFEDAFPEETLVLKSGRVVCRWYRKIANGSPVGSLSKEHSVAFVEKPWLTDFHAFTSIFPNSRFHIGTSVRVQPLRSNAHERAVQDAADQLGLRADQIEPHIVDKFAQSIERPYGKVFREAILVCNPPVGWRNPVAASETRSLDGRIAGLSTIQPFNSEFGLALLACLTVVAGFFTNIATQGYYRSKISNSVIVIAAIIAAVLLVNVLAYIYA